MKKTLAFFLALFILPTVVIPAVSGNDSGVIIAPLVDKFEWFQTHNPHEPDSATFGAYVVEPFGNDLYVGFGAGYMWDRDGAAVGKFSAENNTLTFIGNLNEQGATVMFSWNNTIQIAGSDPCCGDGWELGNHYVLSTTAQTITKYRQSAGLTRVIHSTDITTDGEFLYLAANQAPTSDTRQAGIWKSSNGQLWEQIALPSRFRIHSLTYVDGSFWATVRHVRYETVSLISSADLEEWQTHLTGLDHSLMTAWQNGLLVLSEDRQTLHFVTTGATASYTLPDTVGVLPEIYRIRADVITSDGSYVYAVVNNGQDFTIQKSNTLESWELVHTVDGTPSVLEYWPAQHSLVYGTQGAAGDLFSIALPATPPTAAQLAAQPSVRQDIHASDLLLLTIALTTALCSVMFLRQRQ